MNELEALREAIVSLPEPTLGLKGGVNRQAVLDLVDSVIASRPTADLAALREVLREPIIRAVAGLDGYENPNLEAGAWWETRTKPVLDAVIAGLRAAASRPAVREEGLDVERLARAMFNAIGWPTRKADVAGIYGFVHPMPHGLVTGDPDNPEWIQTAVRIAAEYVALTAVSRPTVGDGLDVEDVIDWLRRSDGRIEDIFGLWTQGKRDDRWVAETLITEGHLAALAADKGRSVEEEGLRELRELVAEMAPAFHATESIRDHADLNDQTGWHVKGIETCVDPLCVEAVRLIPALAADKPEHHDATNLPPQEVR